MEEMQKMKLTTTSFFRCKPHLRAKIDHHSPHRGSHCRHSASPVRLLKTMLREIPNQRDTLWDSPGYEKAVSCFWRSSSQIKSSLHAESPMPIQHNFLGKYLSLKNTCNLTCNDVETREKKNTKRSPFIEATPPKTNMDTQNDGLEKVDSFKI